MKIYSLVLLLPLGVMSGQAMAFYQKPATQTVAEPVTQHAVNDGQAVQQNHPLARVHNSASTIPAILSANGRGFPGCQCPFCNLLRQVAAG